MYIIISTLYGILAGAVTGSVVASGHSYGREGDSIAWCVCTLAGAIIGPFAGVVWESLGSRRGLIMSDRQCLRALGLLAALFVLWMFVLPMLQTAYE